MASFFVTPYPTFNPSNGTSCVVWFDAADPRTMNMSSATVTNWRSKGAYSLFASTFSTNTNPILSTFNGYPGVYFNGSTNCISTNAIANGGTTGMTWIACSVNLTPITATIPIDASLVIAAGSPERAIRYDMNTSATCYSINNGNLRQDTNNNSNGIRGFIDTAATLSTFVNGSSFTTVNSPVTFAQHSNMGFRLGSWNVGYLNGFINEVLIFSTALTTQQYQTVEGYLAQKWGYIESLPAGHPGRISTLYNSNQIYTLPTLTNVNFFSPPSISGLSLWLDAADSSQFTFSSGSNIATWKDKSGLNNTATATGSPVLQTYTINGRQSVFLSNAPYFGGSISITGTTVTTFAVATTTATLPLTGSDQRLVSLENGSGPDYGRTDGTIALFNQGNSSWIGTWRVSGPIANSGITQNVPFLACSKYDGTNGFLWKNGSPGSIASSGSTGTFGVTKYGIGNRANNSSEFWRGYIGEVIIYNTSLSDTDRQNVETYLAQKWGLNSFLPADHPGLNRSLNLSGPKSTSLAATLRLTSTSSPITSTVLNTIVTYLRDYMSEFRNPSFYGYRLDGNSYSILDGLNDMYDTGNWTYPWLISGTQYTSATGNSQQAFSINYASTTATTVDTDFVYASIGYTQTSEAITTSIHPLTVLGFRTTTGRPVGFQLGGNSGADGSGTLASGILYAGDTIQGFTVHAFYRETYAAGDPSHCNLFILLGHPSWGSVFGTINSFADPVANGGNGCFFYTSGAGVSNILAIQILLSKSGGVLVTAAECQTVVQAFVNRVKLAVGF